MNATTTAISPDTSPAARTLRQLAALLKSGNVRSALELTEDMLLEAYGQHDLSVSDAEVNPKMPQMPADNFHALIIALNEATAEFNAGENSFEDPALFSAMDRALKAVEATKLAATTYESAICALRLAETELENFADSELVKPLVKGALAYFDSVNRGIDVDDEAMGEPLRVAVLGHLEGNGASADISAMFARWIEVRRYSCGNHSEDEHEENYKNYRELQVRIVGAHPTTSEDVAMQFVVDTDEGDSDSSKIFRKKMFALAGVLYPDRQD
ncbi:hypothetical protein [Rhizobium sp. AG207R]|uniref:hypothetical protein n=1 Tax=Rhizobium sp. AG207R TaxID=2802287 RepID=UPI0022AC86B4|nr:hypothetical protein [Rhizobium sp. AG207R]MCZ3380395.1 hypothetical protein [Rhizobium sp. AG207R]